MVSWDVVRVDIVRVWMWSLDVVSVGVITRCSQCGYGHPGCGQGIWVWSVRCVWSVGVGMLTVGMGRVWSVAVGMVRVWSVDVGMVCGCGYGQGVVSQGLHFVRASLVLVLTVLFRNLITK